MGLDVAAARFHIMGANLCEVKVSDTNSQGCLREVFNRKLTDARAKVAATRSYVAAGSHDLCTIMLQFQLKRIFYVRVQYKPYS